MKPIRLSSSWVNRAQLAPRPGAWTNDPASGAHADVYHTGGVVAYLLTTVAELRSRLYLVCIFVYSVSKPLRDQMSAPSHQPMPEPQYKPPRVDILQAIVSSVEREQTNEVDDPGYRRVSSRRRHVRSRRRSAREDGFLVRAAQGGGFKGYGWRGRSVGRSIGRSSVRPVGRPPTHTRRIHS